MEWLEPLWGYRDQLLGGLWITIQLTVLAGGLSIILAMIAGVGTLSRWRSVSVLCRIYIEFFRGTSLLVQMFWLFFVLPTLGVDLSPMVCGVWSLGLCFGAYGAEIVRSSLLAVPKGQYDAATALNFSRLKALRIVYLPQALLLMVPLFCNLLIELLKATSLVSLITISELTFEAKNLIFLTYDTARILISVLLIYLVLSQIIVVVMRQLERALARGQRA
jgi:polar amino acid transport system permease protein